MAIHHASLIVNHTSLDPEVTQQAQREAHKVHVALPTVLSASEHHCLSCPYRCLRKSGSMLFYCDKLRCACQETALYYCVILGLHTPVVGICEKYWSKPHDDPAHQIFIIRNIEFSQPGRYLSRLPCGSMNWFSACHPTRVKHSEL